MGNQLKLLRFSPCYKSGGGIDIDRKDTFPQRWETKEYDNTSYQPPLAYNGLRLGEVAVPKCSIKKQMFK